MLLGLFLSGCSFSLNEKDQKIEELEKRLLELEDKATTSASLTTPIAEITTTPKINSVEGTSQPKVIERTIIKEVPVTPPTTPVNNTPVQEQNTDLKITNIQIIPGAYETQVSWNTNLLANGKVILWPTNTPSGNLILNTFNTKNHSIVLTTNPNKTYNYSIESVTSDGKKAVSETKEITTPTDNIAPTITGVSSFKNGAGITMNIYANEPIIATVYYRFIYSNDTSVKTRSFTSFSNTQVAWYELSGYNPNTELEYQIVAYDRSYNKIDLGTKSLNVASIPDSK